MPTVTGMNASDRHLSDTCKRSLTAALGQGPADEIEVGLETSVGQDQIGGDLDNATLTDPTLTGIVQLGHEQDLVGFFGAMPTGQPAGADQAAAPAITAQGLSYTIGTPDVILGDTGNIDLNNMHASIATQINALVADLTAVHVLVNRLRADLVATGMIKGS